MSERCHEMGEDRGSTAAILDPRASSFDARPAPASGGGPGARGQPRIVRNSTLNLMAQGFQSVFNLVVFLVLARTLGKELLGQYYLLFALLMVLQVLLEAGVATMVTRRLVQAPAVWKETVAEAVGLLGLLVPLSLAVFLVLGAAWSWIHGEPAFVLAWVAAGMACASMHVERCCDGVFRAFDQFGYESAGKILQGGLFVGLVLVLVVAGVASVPRVLGAFAVSHVVTAVFLVVTLHCRRHCLGWRLHWPAVKHWLKDSVPLGLSDLVRGPSWQLDVLLLGVFQPAAMVGIYSVASRPHAPLIWLPRAVLAALFPSFARLAVKDPARLQAASTHSLHLLGMAALPVAIAICLCAEPLIRLLVGEQYLEATLPMQLLIWKTALVFVTIQFRFLFTAASQQRAYAQLVMLAFVLEAALELALIPWWGYLGACTGSLCAEIVFAVAGLAVCNWLGLGGVDWRILGRVMVAGAGMAAVLWGARSLPGVFLIPAVVVATAVYFALCIGLGALPWSRLRHFRTLLVEG